MATGALDSVKGYFEGYWQRDLSIDLALDGSKEQRAHAVRNTALGMGIGLVGSTAIAALAVRELGKAGLARIRGSEESGKKQCVQAGIYAVSSLVMAQVGFGSYLYTPSTLAFGLCTALSTYHLAKKFFEFKAPPPSTRECPRPPATHSEPPLEASRATSSSQSYLQKVGLYALGAGATVVFSYVAPLPVLGRWAPTLHSCAMAAGLSYLGARFPMEFSATFDHFTTWMGMSKEDLQRLEVDLADPKED